jgi:hypothetical protein
MSKSVLLVGTQMEGNEENLATHIRLVCLNDRNDPFRVNRNADASDTVRAVSDEVREAVGREKGLVDLRRAEKKNGRGRLVRGRGWQWRLRACRRSERNS